MWTQDFDDFANSLLEGAKFEEYFGGNPLNSQGSSGVNLTCTAKVQEVAADYAWIHHLGHPNFVPNHEMVGWRFSSTLSDSINPGVHIRFAQKAHMGNQLSNDLKRIATFWTGNPNVWPHFLIFTLWLCNIAMENHHFK